MTNRSPAVASPVAEAGFLLSPEMTGFAGLVADSGHPVLLLGETGCGKTHLAREIHARSLRARKPFVRVNCAAIPEGLFEREMFGHVRGAFTDAREGGAGFFEAADGGTLFLDEVGEIPLNVQPKLLAALEEGGFRKLGSPREVRVSVQIIAATNRDLAEMVELKRFRRDLFYRFSVLQYRIPPLRERRAELPELIHGLLRKIASPGTAGEALAKEALALLLDYPWPGNIRELDNALRAGVVFARGGTIQPVHLPVHLRSWRPLAADPDEGPGRRYAAPRDAGRELNMIRAALAAARGNKTRAARSLGMARSTLWAKLQRYERSSPGAREPCIAAIAGLASSLLALACA
ncbi:MAG TPA: sigma-54 dependent transcriptional regulator [Longimicrobiaceae bacterium]